jgi:hypothetical protein
VLEKTHRHLLILFAIYSASTATTWRACMNSSFSPVAHCDLLDFSQMDDLSLQKRNSTPRVAEWYCQILVSTGLGPNTTGDDWDTPLIFS